MRDPEGHGSLSNTDYEGHVTHTADGHVYDSHTDPHNPLYTWTLREWTGRYDLLGRPSMECTWLVQRPVVDPNNPPIAGVDADGDGVRDGFLSQGLPTLTFYDSNLADGIGLDSAAGIALPRYEQVGVTYNVSLLAALAQLQSDTGIVFGSNGSAGSAVLVCNADEELMVSIRDGVGRTVMTARLQPRLADAGTSTGEPITWNTMSYNHTFDLNPGGGGPIGSSYDHVPLVPVSLNQENDPDEPGRTVRFERSRTGRASVPPISSALSRLPQTNQRLPSTFGGEGQGEGELPSSSSPSPRPAAPSPSPPASSLFTKLVEETRTIDALGNITRTRTDGSGRVLQTVDAEANITAMEYDNASNLTKVRDPNQVGYDAVYDQLNRMTSQTDTYGDTKSTAYDRAGNIIGQTDAKSSATTIAVDAADRQVQVTDRLNGITSFNYDLGSNLLSLTDAENQTTSYGYESRGLRTSETYPDHVPGNVPGDSGYGTRIIEYDAAMRPIRFQDQKGNWRTHVHDRADRMKQRQYRTLADGKTGPITDEDVFVYDRASRITSAIIGRYNNAVTMSYDNGGRMSSETLTIDGQSYVTGYQHDARNAIEAIVYPSGRDAAYTYTARHELDAIVWDETQIENRGYDPGGRLTTIDRPHVDETRGYDLANRLTSIANTAGMGTYSYTWDPNCNKLSETASGVMAPWNFTTEKPGAGSFEEGYDPEDRFCRFI